MDNGAKSIIDPIRNPNKGSPEQDVHLEYCKATNSVKSEAPIPFDLPNLLCTVLAQYAEGRGELVISVNSNRAYFELEGKPFTNFGIFLLLVHHVHSSHGQTQYILELLIWGENLPRKIIRIDASDLGSSRWLDGLGPQYICEPRKIQDLKILIQAMAQYAPTKDEYMYSGWVVDKEGTYIMKDHQLCSTDWDAENAKISCAHALSMLEVAPHPLTIPLLAIALLSLVQSRMMALGNYFKGVLCIVAPTQSFKTTLASLFFNFENGREADTNFEASMTAIVRTVDNSRDSTVIVDDFKPGATKAESNDMIHKLSTIIRMCSDDSGGIQKAGTQNTTFSNVAHGLVVVTAEQIQLQVQSTLARLLIFEMSQKSVDVKTLTYFQNEHQKYRDFIQDFVRYIASQGVNHFCRNLMQHFLQERNALRKDLPGDVSVDNRTNDMCTWLWVTFDEFLSYAQSVGAISPEQHGGFLSEGRQVFLSVMEQQAERVSDLNPIKQFFRGLGTLLDTKEATLGALQARDSAYAVADSKTALGFTKRNCVYLKNGVAFQAVAFYYRRLGREFPGNESTLRKALADSGYLVPKDQKSHIHRLSVNRESYQCIQFEESTFNQLLRGGKNNETEHGCELPSDRAVRKNADNFLGR